MSQSIAAQHELWKYFQQTIGNYKSLSKPWSVRAAVGGGWHGEEQQFGSVYMFVMKARQAGFLHSCDRHSIGKWKKLTNIFQRGGSTTNQYLYVKADASHKK